MPRDEQYLVEIVGAAGTIARWLTGVDADKWAADDMMQSAVLLKLITIGEAARAVSENLRSRHPGVEWRDAAAFRNVAVHEYFAIEWTRVRSTADAHPGHLLYSVAGVADNVRTHVRALPS